MGGTFRTLHFGFSQKEDGNDCRYLVTIHPLTLSKKNLRGFQNTENLFPLKLQLSLVLPFRLPFPALFYKQRDEVGGDEEAVFRVGDLIVVLRADEGVVVFAEVDDPAAGQFAAGEHS